MTTVSASQLVYRSPKLGDVPYAPDDVLRFPQGLPGFERLREFLLVTRDECAPFIFLASLEDPTVALPLLPLPAAALHLEAPSAALVPLGETRAATVGYYAVVTIGPGAREITVNLRAPVVVNLDTRRGCQVILPDETLPLAAPLRV